MQTLFEASAGKPLRLAGVNYTLIGFAGQGGSSIVYKARKEGRAEDYYVIKEFFPYDLATGRKEDGTVCFADNMHDALEKRISRALRESDVVNILRHGEENNNPWFLYYSEPVRANNTLYTVIETESGGTLYERIHNGLLAGQGFIAICNCILMILNALEPIHDKGYLHLDVSPDNIHVSILNIMRMIDYNSAFNMSGNLEEFFPSFKEGYSAPEIKKVTDVSKLSFSSDLFSVAAIFFELLIGRPPEENDWINRSRWLLTSEEGILKGASELLVKSTNSFLRKNLSSKPEIRSQSVAQMRDEIILLMKLFETYTLVNSPKRPNPNFVCRDSEIEAIGKILDTDNYVIIDGMGGIGKTELVKKYAWENRSKYDAVQFITYSNNLMTTVGLSLQFHNFDRAKEAEYKMRYGEKAVQYIYRDKMNSLKKGSGSLPYLIIVDNYNVQADDNFTEFISGEYKVIFTSRNRHDGSVLEITEMKEENDLLELFRKYYDTPAKKLTVEDEPVVMDIIRLVLGHTMTVMLIAAAMQKNRKTPGEMRDLLHDGLDPGLRTKIGVDKEEISAEVREQVMYRHITNLFDMTKIQNNLNYSFIMTNMAIVPYTGVETTAFYDMALSGLLEDYGYNNRNYTDIEKLIEMRWIQSDGDRNCISLHPVISDVADKELEPDSVKCRRFIENMIEYSDDSGFESYRENKAYIDWFGVAIKRIKDLSETTVMMTTRYARLNESLANYAAALEYYRKAASLSENVFGARDSNTAVIYNNIGNVYKELGEYGTALEWYLKSLKMSKKAFWKWNPDDAMIYIDIAEIYYMQGQGMKAFMWLQKASIIADAGANNLPDGYEKDEADKITATLYNSTALIYGKNKNYSEALKLYNKALAIYEKSISAGPDNYATIYSNIAEVYARQGDCSKALEWHNKALEILEGMFGKEHPDTADSYVKIGGVYYRQGDYSAALKWCQKGLEIFEHVFGWEHPSTINAYASMAVTYDKLGERDKAREYRRKAEQKGNGKSAYI